MSKWRARMPKQKPPKGQSHFVYGYIDEHGNRLEFSGTLETSVAEKIVPMVVSDMKNGKTKS